MNETSGYPAGCAHDERAPWNCGLDAITEHTIDRRAEELCGEQFDETAAELRASLADDCEPALLDIVCAAIRCSATVYGDSEREALDKAVQRLRDVWIADRADLFRARAEMEVAE